MSGCGSNACDTPCGSVPTVHKTIALVGNPNCGKTTLFNALTGATQRVGNWPGVTVEKKSGYVSIGCNQLKVIDLPGVYSLNAEASALDERITCDFILHRQADVIINIVDASNLERHLYLTQQLLEMNLPVIVALNMIDVARAREIEIDAAQLAKALGCPVVRLEAKSGYGLADLKQLLMHYEKQQSVTTPYPPLLETAIATVTATLENNVQRLHVSVQASHPKRWLAIRLLEDDATAKALVDATIVASLAQPKNLLAENYHEDADLLIADARYQHIQAILRQCMQRAAEAKTSWTERIDHIVLNRWLGIPIFLMMMYALFFFSVNIGGIFQDFFDIASQTIFVDGFAQLLNYLHAPTWLTALLANGLGKGINTTVTFIPVIGALFLFLALLEDSGYMARAAFVVDRFMQTLGLPGKAFVPMIVGFGCNVPAVMAARTLENKRDRILTILMSPFMSCGARLAIFAVFTAAFFPKGGQNIVFALYLIGVLMAVGTGFILRRTVLKGDPAPLIMELPSYHVPKLSTICLHAWQRLKSFLYRAGKLIVPICLLIGALNTLNLDGSLNTGDGSTQSLLSWLGQLLTPIFAPMGIHADNWPATVGLLTGVLAKEVVVGTLNTLYAQMGHFAFATPDGFSIVGGLKEAWQSIFDNFAALGAAFSNPILAKAPIHAVQQDVYGIMYQKFDGQAGAFAYLVFILLYFPCVSTTAAMLRELHKGWSVFSVIWMTFVAYGTAVVFYQAATWARHPLSASLWISGIVLTFLLTIRLMNRFQLSKKEA